MKKRNKAFSNINQLVIKYVNSFLTTTALLFSLFINQLESQTYFKPYIGIVQSKITNNNQKNSSLYVYDEKYDFTNLIYGLKVSKQLFEKLSMGIDISYKKGGSNTGNNFIANDYGLEDVKLQYLDLTVDAQFMIQNYLFCNLGIYNSYLLEAEWTILNGWVYPYILTERSDDKYKNFDRGINLGISGKYKKAVLTIQYQHGLTKIFEKDKLKWVSINLGYEFSFKRKN